MINTKKIKIFIPTAVSVSQRHLCDRFQRSQKVCEKILPTILFATLLFFLLYSPPKLFNVTYSPVLYSRDSQLLGARVAADGQWRFPQSENLNEKFVTSIIISEDKRFYRHHGVDPTAIARATLQNFQNKRIVSGGSTITMQTIRLTRRYDGKSGKRTFTEKIIEAVLALRLELSVPKEDILMMYAANAPFGANVVGLEAASWRWFGRSSNELSWAEAAALAVLPNSPALIHPGRNREALKNKRDSLLRKLNAGGFIDEETLYLSLLENLPDEPLLLPRYAPHLLDRLISEKGGAANFTENASYLTTIDIDIQQRAAAIMNRASRRFTDNDIMNAACLVINTKTGETLAYIGNTVSPSSQDVDIIVSRRSSGSLLKPFLYAAMLDSGDILPASLVSDIPTRVGSFSPVNITRTYLGVVPADEALARSLNVPAARMLRQYGVDRFAHLLRSLGLTTLFRPSGEYGLPLILGGAEVTLWEITGLYAGLGRAANRNEDEAVFFPPNVFFHHRGHGVTRSNVGRSDSNLISSAAAWLTLEALVAASRPGEEAIWQEYARARRIAWKTGTSFGFRDAWAIGVTPEWTVGVWIGNATGEGRAELRSAVTAAPVMFEVFSALDAIGGNRATWFYQPASDLRYAETCASSGFLAGIHCENEKYVFIPKDAPASRVCPFCQTVYLDETLNFRINLSSGSGGAAVEKKYFVLPPAEEWYYRRWNFDYRPLPIAQSASSDRGTQALALFNPEPDGQVIIPRELDGREGRLVLSAAHRDEREVIYWHLDEEYLGMTQNFHEMEMRPLPGRRIVTLVDSSGNTISRAFTVLETAD